MKYIDNMSTHWQYINTSSHIDSFSPASILFVWVIFTFLMLRILYFPVLEVFPLFKDWSRHSGKIYEIVDDEKFKSFTHNFLFINHLLLPHVQSVYIWKKCSSFVSQQWQHRDYLWYLLCKKFFCICDISFVLYN